MKTAHDVIRGMGALHTDKATKIAREQTGIEPGYDPTTGITWTEDGRARKRSGAAAGSAIGAWVILDDTQTIETGIAGGANVSLDTPLYDTSSFWDIGNPDTFTIPVDGAYYISYAVEWDVSDVGYRECFIQHSAFDAAFSRQVARMVVAASPTDDSRGAVITAGDIIQASAGDTLFLGVQQSSGGDLNIIEPSVKIHYVGAKIT